MGVLTHFGCCLLDLLGWPTQFRHQSGHWGVRLFDCLALQLFQLDRFGFLGITPAPVISADIVVVLDVSDWFLWSFDRHSSIGSVMLLVPSYWFDSHGFMTVLVILSWLRAWPLVWIDGIFLSQY